MTDVTITVRAMGGVSIWKRLLKWTAGVGKGRTQHRLYRSTMRELIALSDDELNKMGIHPADIHAVAWRTAYGA